LTDKGHPLGPLLKEIVEWGKKNISGTKAGMKMDLQVKRSVAALAHVEPGTFLFYHQLESVPQIKHHALAFMAAIRFQLADIIVIKVEQ
jgi:hypothetical protein